MGKSEQLDVTAVNLLWIEEKGIGVPLNDNCKSSFYESAFAQKRKSGCANKVGFYWNFENQQICSYFSSIIYLKMIDKKGIGANWPKFSVQFVEIRYYKNLFAGGAYWALDFKTQSGLLK